MKRPSAAPDLLLYPRGSGVQELFQFEADMFKAMADQHVTGWPEDIQKLADCNIIITESYAGTCAQSYAHKRMLDWMIKTTSGKGRVIFYSTTEHGTHQQRLISKMSQSHGHRPLHRFGDLLDRVPQEVKMRGVAIMESLMSDAKSFAVRAAASPEAPSYSKKWVDERRESLGKELFLELDLLVRETRMCTAAYCFEHGKHCNINPRDSIEALTNFEGYDPHLETVWFELAGNTCCPWSRLVSGMCRHYLDPATFPMLVWAHSCKKMRPTAIIQENVEGFEEIGMVDLLAEQPRPFAPVGESAAYSCVVLKGKPLDVGFPASGARKFLLAIRNECCCFKTLKVNPAMVGVEAAAAAADDGPQGDAESISQAGSQVAVYMLKDIFKPFSQNVDLADMLRATPEMIDSLLTERFDNDQLYGLDSANSSFFDSLLPSQRRRLHDHEEKCIDMGICDVGLPGTPNEFEKKWSVGAAIVCLNNESGYVSANTMAFPRLLKGSILYDMVTERALVPEELWFMQGWPVPGMLPRSLTRSFPHETCDFQESQHKVFMGNSVHVNLAAAVSAFAIGAVLWPQGDPAWPQPAAQLALPSSGPAAAAAAAQAPAAATPADPRPAPPGA
ncbi:unnamed protein product [Prorocentrum cordatum]|uniref:Uncharacterized protein n=1 Tax=Prorocentrum cordatum TaxID=2364126 RepID=A0ABN9SZ45_9DINO|nr:unnamed protein product [Polarella glacialis]CAK0837904.1 unnamed protein product [Polarella glacialis]